MSPSLGSLGGIRDNATELMKAAEEDQIEIMEMLLNRRQNSFKFAAAPSLNEVVNVKGRTKFFHW